MHGLLKHQGYMTASALMCLLKVKSLSDNTCTDHVVSLTIQQYLRLHPLSSNLVPGKRPHIMTEIRGPTDEAAQRGMQC